eukprot:snap_masked-scaffold_5-processed-gene-16.30-mRNA-1 protein AED:0.37 eAED:0.53 QI:0/-1/0/1/-1/1/1/0/131
MKFLSVKIVIFATYYQKLVFDFVPAFDGRRTDWNNFILCAEMPFFALIQYFGFSFAEFVVERQGNDNEDLKFDEKLGQVLDWKDVAKDAYYNFNNKYKSHLRVEDDFEGYDDTKNAQPVSLSNNTKDIEIT